MKPLRFSKKALTRGSECVNTRLLFDTEVLLPNPNKWWLTTIMKIIGKIMATKFVISKGR